MPGTIHNPRSPHVETDCLFSDHWSPRPFPEEPLSQSQISALFEAARWTVIEKPNERKGSNEVAREG